MKVQRSSTGLWTATGYGFRFESRTLEGLFNMLKEGIQDIRQQRRLEK